MISLSYVAFIDILGFSEMVTADCDSADPGSKFLPRLKKTIHKALAEAKDVNADINQFSDSIIVSAPFSPKRESLEEFVLLSGKLQSLLFLHGVICRGEIAHGRHYHDETILFSRALIDAYAIESSVSRNPRIVVSRETTSLVLVDQALPKLLVHDEDGEIFVDYFSLLQEDEVRNGLTLREHDLRSKSAGIRSKISWLFKYANFTFPGIILPNEISMRRV